MCRPHNQKNFTRVSLPRAIAWAAARFSLESDFDLGPRSSSRPASDFGPRLAFYKLMTYAHFQLEPGNYSLVACFIPDVLR